MSSQRIVEASSKVVVMAEKGRELLRSVYQVPDEKIEIIPHGIPGIRIRRARRGQGQTRLQQTSP